MTSTLNKQTILHSFEDGTFPGGVHLFDTIGSTNEWSRTEIRRGRQLPFVCIADHQDKGRGRRGRHWLSPAGANIYMSVAWSFALPLDKLVLLPLAQGVAVLRALERAGIDDAWLKWPNDVLINDKKIAGILVEASSPGGNACQVVIGLGLNYAMPENFVVESGMRWTDIARSVSGTLPDRNVVAAELLNQVVKTCRHYQHKSTAIYTDISHALDALTGRKVDVHVENGDQVTGNVLGISETGELRVLVNGHERIFNSADVSLRGFEGRQGSRLSC
jgi:BirA family biotin operon repressor/biotin-[acetyl-CoA-carboxylase] ligase